MSERKTAKPTDDLDKRFRAVAYFPQTDTFLVTFLDGRAYHLPPAIPGQQETSGELGS